ncbi:PLP-dependent aminotransferase family protein [Paenibacillus solisilvae]|uniref:PLP-dependent aminotransferase family protein n=1 Tax=Paenibacillus solisilvae TaxID=2486751 RepID=A0ABW0VSL9_9BACL
MPFNSFDNYPMSWKPDMNHLTAPLYVSIAEMLEKDIKEGLLSPGTKLPPQRELADFLDVNLSTISKAFKICEQKGLIGATVGRGTFVSSDVGVNKMLLPNHNLPGVIELGSIFPEHTLNNEIASHMKKMVLEPGFGDLFGYGHPEGSIWQKEAAVKLIGKANFETEPQQILLASGGQNAIMAILAGLFKPGDKIGTDPLTYPGIKTAASMLGIQLVAIHHANNEITQEGLLYACKNENIKGLYLIPDFHNPTTHTMSAETRRMIAEVAVKEDLIVIEDAIHSLLHENPPAPIAAFAPEKVLYVCSVSKVISPGLRLAYIVTPEAFKKKLSAALYNMNISVPPMMTEFSARIINNGIADTILDKRRAYSRERNEVIKPYLGDYEMLGAPESSFRWLILPDYTTGKDFELRAYQAGVQVYGSERFAVGTAMPQSGVRLAITATENTKQLREAVKIIRALLENEADDRLSLI